ncbi:hypothetical protein SCP_0409020 [Sparassis crispa]|uniref:Uncharacterized protein n=1 Tax=Sparassis crispa TaxID=139825 RepID=A0A401GK22_9APHY|nr:hypothetical protein SCP_0409020 [Sparassis crispa]GBE82518.1 hypothetical protein SCP_0409020 [Sparassis crispa]
MSKFSPSPQEVALVNQIFAQADTQKLGVVTGDAAVKIFSGSKLLPTVLAEVWSIADEDNNGVLTRKGVAIAVRLLGHAQRGEKVTEAMVNRPGPVPTIEGLTPPVVQQSTGIPSSKSPPPGLPPLTPQDKAKFMRLFLGCGPISGLLSGEKARDVFVRSKLPVDKLSQIWNLADTKNRGCLDAADFTVAMYLIQASMSGQLQTIPPVLPPVLYEQAGGAVTSHATGESGSLGSAGLSSFSGRPMSTIIPQFTGSSSAIQPQMTGQMRSTPTAPSLPVRSVLSNTTPAFPFVQRQGTGLAQHWDVTPSEKASADKLFDGLDTQKRGYIEGDVAVPFMLQSKLPEDVLAQVWDLADLNNDGRLTRDGFAVAMHLIQSKLSGKEIPSSIPTTLVPPSMRAQATGSAAPSQLLVSESIRDLLWDDSPPPSATAPQHPHPTLQPQATGTMSPRSTMASSPQRAYTIGVSDPFTSSTFAGPTLAVHKDLLGDDDEHTTSSPALHDQSAEIGNLTNQLASTNRFVDIAKSERENVERTLAEQAAQLSSLQTQLSSAKAAYETETRLLNTLRERFTTQASEIQKAREDIIHSESDLSAVRVEKVEIEGAFLRDKEEVRELQRKMTEVGTQVETLKSEVEKAKKDAKQQKGLLAIAKKQLATREAERLKVEREMAEAQNDVREATTEREEAEAELAKEVPATMTNGHEGATSPSPDIVAIAAAHPLPVTPDLSAPISPMSTGNKSTNPFERVSMASGSQSQSPFLPFANAALLPTPSTVVNALEAVASPPVANPFHFDQAFGTAEASVAPPMPPPVETEVTPAEVEHAAPTSNGELDLISPTDTDMFATPPTTASGAIGFVPGESTDAATVHSPLVDVATAPYPPAPQPADQPPPTATHHEEHTDLDHQLKELEVDESDSESEAEDNQPLSAVKAKLSTGRETSGSSRPTAPPISSVVEDPFGAMTVETSAPVSPSPSTHAAAAASPSSVHDAFGAPFASQLTAHESPVAQAVPAVEKPKSNGAATATEAAAGVSDFDEAMGNLSGSVSTGVPSRFSQFTFDSAFDDNFDFAAATAASSPPHAANGSTLPTVATPQKGAFDSIFMSQPSSNVSAPAPAPPSVEPLPFPQAPTHKAPETRPLSFDDAFGAAAGTTDSQVTSSQSGPSNASHVISFDDAFGGHLSEALALDTSFGAESHQSNGGLPSQGRTDVPFSSASPPLSPIPRSMSPEMHARRSISPARNTTPPPHHFSPKPRHSGSSEEKKTPSTRTSKLSIRLPFGRKKHKHDTAPPVPLSHQALVEEPTPAVDDDVEAVKQLCGMGFSRTQAVMALENNAYDVQRALNSLLGAQ